MAQVINLPCHPAACVPDSTPDGGNNRPDVPVGLLTRMYESVLTSISPAAR